MAVHVFIATTEGASRVQRIAEEDSDIPSVICLNGTTETLAISPDYGRFVRRGSGVVARLTGHDSYRIDVDRPIDGGRSWQLGILLAHLLVLAGRFSGGEIEAQDTLVLATGEVDRDLNLRPVGHIPVKIAQAAGLLRQAAAQGTRVLFFLPDSEPEEPWRAAIGGAGLSATGIDFLPVPTVADTAALLGISLPEPVNGRTPAGDTGTALGPSVTPPPGTSSSAGPRRRRIGALGVAAAGLVLSGVIGVAAMRFAPAPTERFLTAYGPAGLSDFIGRAAGMLPGADGPAGERDPGDPPEANERTEPEIPAGPVPEPAPEGSPGQGSVASPEPGPVGEAASEPAPGPGTSEEPVEVVAVDAIAPDSVVLAAAEERAPAGFTCASLRFTGDDTRTAALDVGPDGNFSSGESRALCGLTYGIVNRGAAEVIVAATIENDSGTILIERRNMPVPAGEVVFLPLARDEIDWSGLTVRVRVTDLPEGNRLGFDLERRHRFIE